MKKQIKLQTPDGEQVFPLADEGQKTKGMGEGELVTVELNEAGTVIDMHRADIGGHYRLGKRADGEPEVTLKIASKGATGSGCRRAIARSV